MRVAHFILFCSSVSRRRKLDHSFTHQPNFVSTNTNTFSPRFTHICHSHLLLICSPYASAHSLSSPSTNSSSSRKLLHYATPTQHDPHKMSHSGADGATTTLSRNTMAQPSPAGPAAAESGASEEPPIFALPVELQKTVVKYVSLSNRVYPERWRRS